MNNSTASEGVGIGIESNPQQGRNEEWGALSRLCTKKCHPKTEIEKKYDSYDSRIIINHVYLHAL